MSFGRLFLFCCGVDVVQKLGGSRLLLRFNIWINAFANLRLVVKESCGGEVVEM